MLITNILALIGLQLAIWPLWVRIDSLPHEVPLWYTAEPLSQLAPVEFLWLLPGLSAVVWLVNLSISLWLFRRYSTISRLLAVVSATTCLLAAIGMLKTIMIFTDLL